MIVCEYFIIIKVLGKYKCMFKYVSIDSHVNWLQQATGLLSKKDNQFVVEVICWQHEATYHKKVQVGKDQEKVQLEKNSHSKNRGGKKLN